MAKHVNTNLGEYLRRMRERVRPDNIGLVSRGHRRVPGLRREEVAALAGMSATYYTRLEQSETAHVSPVILSSIARALKLSADEEKYLLKIGSDTPVPRRHAQDDDAVTRARMLVDSLGDAAVAVLDFRCDILAWNSLFHRLIAPHLDFAAPGDPFDRPNVIKLNFLDDRVRAMHTDWASESRRNVSYVRFIAGSHRHDAQLAELISELNTKSPDFADLWRSHCVGNHTTGTKTIDHPHVGPIDLRYEAAQLGDGSILKIYHAEPGSPHDATLKLLRLPGTIRVGHLAGNARSGR